ncbi:MAG TPA: SMP-30/gluconolactonase/LRE family protein [Vicinamibacterales bacterium]|nr:SMP-30/gluconolactonase/LRE family protein [Vicinamibacterales bacterium]
MSKHRSIDVHELRPFGSNLRRPECVVATREAVFVPDWSGGVTQIAWDGSQQTVLPRRSHVNLRPNGIALCPDGSFLLANLGEEGGVWRLPRNGDLEPFLTEVDGVPLPPANFVITDASGRTWISVSTRARPRHRAWRPDHRDGFVVVVDEAGARIAAEGLHYTNEVRPDPAGSWLYVVETFAKRLSRFRITPAGELRARETVATLGAGCFPDGFEFDRDGAIWLTSLISNRLLRVADGDVQTILEDVNFPFVHAAEQAFAEGRLAPEHLGPIPGTTLQQLTSIAFAGPDGRTVMLGSLHATCLYRFRADVPGAAAV